MDLLKKIQNLKNKINELEKLSEDLNDNILSKQKKIDHLKNQIEENINKIDKIIEKHNANT